MIRARKGGVLLLIWAQRCCLLSVWFLKGLGSHQQVTSEAYDPETNSWSPGNSRAIEAAALVPLRNKLCIIRNNNKLCIIRNNISMSLVDVLNPDKNNPRVWENIAVKGQYKNKLRIT
ncbi:unnamed protein product [Eruca vesicaria subsp. sativa]|uniref:Uncharacterized protein n=1 Tax=Eruca vesicaria subsp. sativa TaxID=29727 RepID=A0ABC8LIM0_ERUVS|nr:unnamed protein product [Eruca vesicaria subsp. sativa]